MATRILVIDDDEAIATTVSTYLRTKGYQVDVAHDGQEGLEIAGSGRYAIVITDIYIDRVTGLEILSQAKAARPDVAVILMTARGSMRTTMQAEAGGAFEYLAKPFELRELLNVVERARRAAAGPEAPALEPEDMEQFGDMIGFSPAMVDVYKRIARFAQAEDTVLILGETGVGKEMVARAIHDQSPRASRPFAALDSGAVTGTLWESELFGSLRGAFTGADRDRAGI
ncbi:MAG: sigma-54-dependent Fis family transcriptional regulator, partial [Acidobacteria bacterium]|nr:sigma-54-dependent Fis family transcriptional regulator [Acidobacteriota bacterium]